MENVIVGIGEILWDIFPKGKVLGGAPANFAYHVSQFGFDGYAVSAIGDDYLGDAIIDSLEVKELKYLIEKTPYPTGTVKVTVDENGGPQYEICEDVAWDNIPFTEEMEKLARQAKAVCFGSLAQRHHVSRETISLFLDYVSPDAYIVFDINLRQHYYSHELIDSSLSRCNVLKINDEELAVVAELFGWKSKAELDICYELIEKYRLNMIVLTRGANGSYVITPNETSFKKTPLIVVTDTVGAGDSFTASFVAAMLNGKSVKAAHQLAVDVSAFVCTQHGAMPLLPDSLLSRITN